ncbi:DNA pilot protein [Dipodfec virus UOA04_Rod_760]|nr:DNA pilot protein [Dipodfec virus UOA04_Rod_760]
MAGAVSGAAIAGGVSKAGFNWSGLASGLGNIGSAFIGSVGSARAAKKAYQYNRQLMKYQNQLTHDLNRSAYQDTTYSMREAGINPMLAITQGINGLSAGSGGSVPVQNPVEAGVNTALSRSAIKNERMLAESNSNSANSTAENTKEQTKQFKEWNPQIQQEMVNKLKEEVNLTKASADDLRNQIKNRDRMTSSQIDANSANSYFNRNRALGFSETRSGSGQLGAKVKGISGNIGGSYSHSKSW